jgi:ribonuclease HII
VEEIDRLNILNARMLAMTRAVEGLRLPCDHALIDGNKLPKLNMPATALIKGDARVAAISAASVLAKVQRDRDMVAMEERFPGYGFAKHKGYGTKMHLEALEALGPCEIHRRSYAPVKRLLTHS